jgi:hypothetical protein
VKLNHHTGTNLNMRNSLVGFEYQSLIHLYSYTDGYTYTWLKARPTDGWSKFMRELTLSSPVHPLPIIHDIPVLSNASKS